MDSNEPLAFRVIVALDPALMIPALALIAALLVSAVIVAFVRRWQLSTKPLSPSASDQLAQFRTLYEQGAISEEEFKKLRSVLGGEIRRFSDLPQSPQQPDGLPKVQDVQVTHPASDTNPDPPETGIRPSE